MEAAHTTSLAGRATYVLVALLTSAVFFIGASLPANVLGGHLGPASAEAYQYGYDSSPPGITNDRAWVKISRAEVIAGVARRACDVVTSRFAPPAKRFCPVFASLAAQRLGGGRGVWGEFYPFPPRYRIGTW